MLENIGKTFNISIKNNVYTNMPVEADGSLRNASGLEYKLLQTLAETLNFKYNAFPSVDGEWGRNKGNHTWSGALGMVQRKECDFSICYLSPSFSRQKYFDFSIPYTDDDIVFVTKAPTLTSTEGIFFLKPFTFYMWIGWIAVYVIINAFLTFAIKKTETIKKFPTTWFLFGALVKQSDMFVLKLREIKYISNRMVFTIWLLFSTIFGLFYGGSLTATTSIAPREPVITTVAEMAEAVANKKYFVGVVEGTFYYELIANADKEPFTVFGSNFRKVYEKDALEQIMNERMAYLTPAKEFEIEARTNGFYKQVHFILEYAFAGDVAIAFQKDFPHQQSFNRVIQMLSESGIFLKWNFNMMSQMSDTHDNISDTSKMEPLSSLILQQDMDTALEMLFGFNCVAFVVFLLERLHYKHKGKRPVKKSRPNLAPAYGQTGVFDNYIISYKIVKVL